MRGSIVLANEAGRALRKGPAAVRTIDVLYSAGGFSAGDSIYISFLGADGGQYVVATGVACYPEAELHRKIGLPLVDAHARVCDPSDASVIVLEQDIVLLWPPIH